MTGLTIRRAGTADAHVIAALHARAFADAWSAPSIARLISGPGGFALIASQNGEDIGFALLQCVPPEAELLSIGVEPSRRMSGIGRYILARAAAELMQTGANTMFLDVAADNKPAIALYRALGFGDISTRPRYYPGNIDAIVMKAGLSGMVGSRN